MRYMSVLWWAFSSVAICVSSKYLLVEVDSNQLEEHKLKETLESGPERELVSNKSIGDCELIPEMIKNIPRIQMPRILYEYQTAEIGQFCEGDLKPISNAEECEVAHHSKFNDSKFVEAKGDGFDLPPGCIYDRLRPNIDYVYWNAKGKTISFDARVRPICKRIKEPDTNLKVDPLNACVGKRCGDKCCGPACGWRQFGKCNNEGTCMTWPHGAGGTDGKCEDKYDCESLKPDCTFPVPKENCQKYCGLCEALELESAEKACKAFGNDWKITRRTPGSAVCTKGSTKPLDNCHGCESWRLFVWKDGYCEKLVPRKCRFSTTKAGNYYCGYDPCNGGDLKVGGPWWKIKCGSS